MDRTTIRGRVIMVLSQFVDDLPASVSELENSHIISDQMLDSFSVVSVVAIIEDEFDIHFSAEELSSERMRTVGGLLDLIQKKNEI